MWKTVKQNIFNSVFLEINFQDKIINLNQMVVNGK